MSIINLKLDTEIKLQIELEAWRNGDRRWNVSNQFNESVLESAVENFDAAFDTQVHKWLKDGSSTPESLQTIAVMDWAFCLSEFQPSEIDSAWID